MIKAFKYIFCFGVVFLAFNCNSPGYQNKNWQVIDVIPGYVPDIVTWDYYDLKAADSLNFMVLAVKNGNSGYYLRRTTDGGSTWNIILKDTSFYIDFYNYNFVPVVQSLSYPSTNLFIGVGDSGLVIRSTDKGETWDKYFLSKTVNIFWINMLDAEYGLLGGYDQEADTVAEMVTFDGGKTWKNLNFKWGLSFISIINKNLFCGGRTIKNKDSIYTPYMVWVRDNWVSYELRERPPNVDVSHFINEKQGWIVGGKKVFDSAGWTSYSQLIYYTDDGGFIWQKQWDTVLNGVSIIDIRFHDENFGIATSEDGWALITTNGGKNWNAEKIDSFPINDGATHNVRYIQFPTPNTAIVVEDWRKIYKYTREPVNVVETEISKSDEFTISPNPAEDFIEISGISRISGIDPTLKRGVEVVQIFNVFGEKIPPRLTASATPQEGNLLLDISMLPSGVYFVRVGNKVGKFVKI